MGMEKKSGGGIAKDSETVSNFVFPRLDACVWRMSQASRSAKTDAESDWLEEEKNFLSPYNIYRSPWHCRIEIYNQRIWLSPAYPDPSMSFQAPGLWEPAPSAQWINGH
ncbi:hypothetical protein TNCV_816071 [Trichonephila clavipes]|nr:hypothetical protein TNCV_816071 [Trichonephila clavipes]